jgi:hypothetical protein
MLAHLQQGRYGDYQLLHPQSVQIMQAPAFVPIPGTLPVSLGLFRTDYNGHRIIGHSGDVEGFHTDMKLLTDDNVGFFVAANSDGAVQGLIPAAFTLRNALIQKFMDRYFPAPTTQDEPTAPTAKEHAHLAVGEYVWSRQQKGDYQEALFLLGRFLALRIDVHANADGTVETPAFIAFEGGPTKTWREVSPFVWREVGGKAHLFMKARDGQVQSLWTDEVASFMVDLKVPFLWSAGLNIPLLGLASSTLLVTVLLWPIAAIVRRRYGQTLQLAEPEGRAYRLTRFAALLGVLYMFGWVIALAADFSSTVGVEPWIRLIQLIGLACVAGAAVAVWNARLTCLGQRSRWAKAWSTVLALALLYIVWFSFSFHLISVHLS